MIETAVVRISLVAIILTIIIIIVVIIIVITIVIIIVMAWMQVIRNPRSYDSGTPPFY